jgi:hypothetical protein
LLKWFGAGPASDHDTTAHNSLAVQEGQPRHFKVQVKLMHNESGFVNCELELQLTGNAKQYESSICIIDLKDLEDAMEGKYKPVDITSGLARFDFTGSPLHAPAVAISCCAENPRPWFEVVPDLIRLLLRTKSSCVDLEISFVTQSSEKKLRSRWWSSTPDSSRRSSMANTFEIPSSYHMGQEAIDRFSGLFFAVLCFAWLNHMPNLVKLVVDLRPWLACPISQDQALVVSTLMKCNTMQQVAELLLKFNPSLLRSMSDQAKELFRIEEKLYKPSFLLNQNIHELAPLILLGQQYKPSILPWSKCPLNAVGKPFIFTRPAGLPRSVQDVQRCYAETVRLVHTLDKVRNKFWKFDAYVSGLRSPWSTENSKQSWQNITLEVEMECEVVPNCDLALKLSNLKFSNGGFHNYRASSSSSAELGFFLSHVALCVTPKVELEDCQLTKLEADTALNQTYDFAGANASGWTGTLNLKSAPTVAFNKTTTATLAAKSVTDWYHVHGTELHDRKSGTFSWTLNRLGGIPFNYQEPYPFPTGTNFAGWSSSLPFDKYGRVVFTDKMYPDKITWMLAPKMEGRTVEWLVSVEFCVTILNNIRSRKIKSQSLTFRCTNPLKYKLISPMTRN